LRRSSERTVITQLQELQKIFRTCSYHTTAGTAEDLQNVHYHTTAGTAEDLKNVQLSHNCRNCRRSSERSVITQLQELQKIFRMCSYHTTAGTAEDIQNVQLSHNCRNSVYG
jgi:hypothetical protein